MLKLWFRMIYDKPDMEGHYTWTSVYIDANADLVMETMAIWRTQNAAYVFHWERA